MIKGEGKKKSEGWGAYTREADLLDQSSGLSFTVDAIALYIAVHEPASQPASALAHGGAIFQVHCHEAQGSHFIHMLARLLL